MNAQNLELARAHGLVDAAYVEQGAEQLRKREAMVRNLLAQRSLPDEGWDDDTIMMFIQQLSAMDSNNFLANVGAGEREARVFSRLVRERNYGLGHGIGRSGDIAAVQPKAAGSSLIYKLTNRLVLHAIRLCGVVRTEAALVLPLATGMTLTLALLTLKAQRPPTAKYVIWSRIDQKSCFKCILTAGCEPVVMELVRSTPASSGSSSSSSSSSSSGSGSGSGGSAAEAAGQGDELRTDVAGIRAAITRLGADNVVAVITTTSCFAPRGMDRVADVAEVCADTGVGHIVNHAYGLQSSKACHELNEACRNAGPLPTGAAAASASASATAASAASAASGVRRRVDAWISSCDKNFLVPVGGAIVASPSPAFVDAVSRAYPGRASIAPVLDLFITLLSMGQAGLKALLAQRKEVFAHLKTRIGELAAAHGERVLHSPNNQISIAMTLDNICSIAEAEAAAASGGSGSASAGAAAASDGAAAATIPTPAAAASKSSTYLGSMLFSRGVSGTRVVARGEVRKIDRWSFTGYGAQCNDYPHTYLTAAAAMGMSREEVDVYVERLSKTIAEYKKQQSSSNGRSSSSGGGSSSSKSTSKSGGKGSGK